MVCPIIGSGILRWRRRQVNEARQVGAIGREWACEKLLQRGRQGTRSRIVRKRQRRRGQESCAGCSLRRRWHHAGNEVNWMEAERPVAQAETVPFGPKGQSLG